MSTPTSTVPAVLQPAEPAPAPRSASRAKPAAEAPPSPSPLASEPSAESSAPSMVSALVTHGELRRDGTVYEPNTLVDLPPDEARQLAALGVVRVVRPSP